MRVLVFTQYFTPEVGATSTRLETFVRGLAAAGHEVEVVCEVPNHPQGVVHPGYSGRLLVRRRLGGARVRYVWVWTRPEKTSRDRMLFYATYAAMAVLVGSASRRPDVVLASSPPLPVAAAAAMVAARHRVPWVLDVRDLWPDAAVALGEMGEGAMLERLEALERRLYASAAAITTVTEPFRATIAERAPAGKAIELIPNGTTALWVDGASLEVAPEDAGLPRERFVWTFAGNIGLAQGLDAAIEAAALLGEGFELQIVGDGAARPGLERQAAGGGGNVVFRDQVPPAEALRIVRASGALLVPLADDPILASFVPSKLFDFCAAGRPVVVAAAGEPARLADEAGAALTVPPGDPAALADAVRRVAADEALRARLGDAGRAFGVANLRDAGVARLEEVLVSASRARRPGSR